MKIAIYKPTVSVSSVCGVKVQGKMWRDGLVALGHQVDLVNIWDDYDWDSYDWLIMMGYGGNFRDSSRAFSKLVKRLAIAPIVDPDCGYIKYKFYTKYWGNQKHLGLSSRFHDLYLNKDVYKLWLVRSDFEKSYVTKCLEIDESLIDLVPLQYRVPSCDTMPIKENFCFHASRLAASNKNVPRLIEAAKKYGFNLVLAGMLASAEEKQWLHNMIDGNANIKYVGQLTDEELLSYYRRCKVFALPSITEGVGMVALEAAANGAEIVLTNDGGPKYYLKDHAEIINPYSVDDIGRAVMKLMERNVYQPALLDYMKNNFSAEACSKQLEKALKDRM
jgi:glycosyltransferase involved in cell wall biosynthesis